MPRVLKILAIVLLVTSAISAFLLVRARSLRLDNPSAANPLVPEDRVKGLFVPDFTLTAPDGKAVTNEVFKGRVTVVDFFFTHCPFICPTLTAKMAELAQMLKGVPNARFLSISVDPEHDTPERLGVYAREHARGPSGPEERWTFATAHGQADAEADLRRLVTDGLKFDLGADAKNMINLPGGGQMANVRHPPYFVVVGPKGEVLDIFTPTIPGELEAAAARVRAVAERVK